MISFGKTGGSTQQPSSVWNQQAPFLQSLYGGAQGLASQQQGSIGQASQNTSQGLFNWLGQGSPSLQGQIQGFGQNLGNFWNQQVLPGINQDASYYGGSGGSRQGIAQGLGAQGILQQYQQGVTGLQAADYSQNLQNIGSLYNLGMAPYSAQWQPYQQLAGVLGDPTVLGGGGHAGSGFNFGFGSFGR